MPDPKITMTALDAIKPYANNPRQNDGAVDAVARSIEAYGFKVPLVIDRDGTIVTGHTRYKAAKQLGLDAVPCIIADDLTDEQLKAFRLADNKVAEIATWDQALLQLELKNLGDLTLDAYGFDDLLTMTDGDFDDDGDGPELVEVTFTLAPEQRDEVMEAIRKAGHNAEETYGNVNRNGNALYKVAREWAERKTSD